VMQLTAAATQQGPQSGVDAAASLECASEDLVYEAYREFLPPEFRQRGPGTNEQAFRGFLAAQYPKLRVGQFEEVARTDEAVQLALVRDGKRVASVYVARDAKGWKVEHFAACNALLLDVIDTSTGGRG